MNLKRSWEIPPQCQNFCSLAHGHGMEGSRPCTMTKTTTRCLYTKSNYFAEAVHRMGVISVGWGDNHKGVTNRGESKGLTSSLNHGARTHTTSRLSGDIEPTSELLFLGCCATDFGFVWIDLRLSLKAQRYSFVWTLMKSTVWFEWVPLEKTDTYGDQRSSSGFPKALMLQTHQHLPQWAAANKGIRILFCSEQIRQKCSVTSTPNSGNYTVPVNLLSFCCFAFSHKKTPSQTKGKFQNKRNIMTENKCWKVSAFSSFVAQHQRNAVFSHLFLLEQPQINF